MGGKANAVSRKRHELELWGGSKRKSGGFSLLELVVVIVLISFLVTLAISRLLAAQVDAERVTMETVAGTLRSAIGMKVAESIVKYQVPGLSKLEGSNPMDLLAETPRNYLGEFDGVDPSTLQDGSWYFDKRAKTLDYLVRNKGFFTGGASNPPRARFTMRLVYSDKNGNGVFDRGVDEVQGLRLSPVEPYSWSRE